MEKIKRLTTLLVFSATVLFSQTLEDSTIKTNEAIENARASQQLKTAAANANGAAENVKANNRQNQIFWRADR